MNLDVVLCVYNPRTREVEAEGSDTDIILSQVFEILSQKQQKTNQMKTWTSQKRPGLASPVQQGLGFKKCVPPYLAFAPVLEKRSHRSLSFTWKSNFIKKQFYWAWWIRPVLFCFVSRQGFSVR